MASATLLLSLWVVTASLLASPLNCALVGLGLCLGARLALLTQHVIASCLSPLLRSNQNQHKTIQNLPGTQH